MPEFWQTHTAQTTKTRIDHERRYFGGDLRCGGVFDVALNGSENGEAGFTSWPGWLSRGLRMKDLWTVLMCSLTRGIAFFSRKPTATNAGRESLILDTCITSGELLGAGAESCCLLRSRRARNRIADMHPSAAKPVQRWNDSAGRAGIRGDRSCFWRS